MDLNEVIEIQVEDKDFPRKNEFCLMGAPTRKQFPNNIDLSSQMTKPEDQGSHGTCMAFSGTTFVESLLWRLTGEKDEFTADELYNIYFDAYGKCNGLTIDANERKTLRGPEGKWDADWKYGGTSYYVFPFIVVNLAIQKCEIIPNIWVFVICALFSWFTVRISCEKPWLLCSILMY